MENDNLETVLSVIVKERHGDEGQGSDPINLLLQIVLPITLILAIIVFTKVNWYNELVRDLEIDPFHLKYEYAYIELQRQVLIRMIEETKAEEKRYLGYEVVSRDMQNIAFKYFDEKLVQVEYRSISTRALDHLQSRRSEVEDSIYNSIITRTDNELSRIEDSTRLQHRRLRQLREKPGLEKERQDLLEYARGEARSFLGLFADECATYQSGMIESIHKCFGDNFDRVDEWDPKLEELAKLLKKANTEKERRIYSREISVRLDEKVKEDFEEQGAPFLSLTWEMNKTEFSEESVTLENE